MRKHNKRFAQRWGRDKGDRSNIPQNIAHSFVHNKSAQFLANGLLHVQLKHVVPEALKPRRIQVQGGRPVIQSEATPAQAA